MKLEKKSNGGSTTSQIHVFMKERITDISSHMNKKALRSFYQKKKIMTKWTQGFFIFTKRMQFLQFYI